jgi:DNA (cytosine-5)-methyltransferase 1
MRFLSVCSGIEAASVAWSPLGWTAAAFSEIEPFPCAVLAHHYPNVPNLGNLTKYHAWPSLEIEILVGGTPCQSFSVAGLRAGMQDPRGNLALTFLGVAERYRPAWLVWENVPGVLSSNGGRDFGSFLGGLVQLGYGFAYRVLDAQYFGVPQRRRRVFVVGYLGDWRVAAQVLFERHCLSGDSPKGREKGERIALCLEARTEGGGAGWGTDFMTGGGIVSSTEISHCLNAGGMGRQDYETETLVAAPITSRPYADHLSQESNLPLSFRHFTGPTDTGAPQVDMTPTLRGNDTSGLCVFDTTQLTSAANYSNPQPGDPCYPLAAGAHAPAIAGQGVRRLTPRECERLQGFPDDYTLVPFRGKPAKDGPRYKALGNSMAVPVMRWIGERIQNAT